MHAPNIYRLLMRRELWLNGATIVTIDPPVSHGEQGTGRGGVANRARLILSTSCTRSKYQIEDCVQFGKNYPELNLP